MTLLSASKANVLKRTRTDLAVSGSAESNAMTAGTHANWLNVTTWNFERTDPQYPDRAQAVDAITEFDLEIWCDANEDLTTPKLYGVRAHPVTLADDDVDTVDDTNNELDLTSHAYQTGDGPVQLTTSGTLPTGISLATNYWIRDIGANSIQLHTSRDDAITNTDQVTFSDTGSGTHTIVDVQSSNNPDDDTTRLHWHLYGDLNEGNTINVDVQEAYIERIQHSPLTLYYEVTAGATNTETTSFRAVPVQTVEW